MSQHLHVAIHVSHPVAGEMNVRRDQATDAIGRPTEQPETTVNAVVDDVTTWIGKNVPHLPGDHH